MKKVALLGAGYIAAKHLDALQALPNLKVQAICDSNRPAAEELAKRAKCSSYSNFDEMVASEPLDLIHILLPPDKHFEFASKTLAAGKGVFIEKPMALSVKECQKLAELAGDRLPLGINHNTVFFPCYVKLKNLLQTGALGPLDHVTLTWQKGWNFLQSGPYDAWMVREPQNVCFETGPHIFSCLIDLLGQKINFAYGEPSDPIILPNGRTVFRRWIGVGYLDKTCVEVRLSVKPGFDEHTLEVRGTGGSAKADFNQDLFTYKQHTDYIPPLDMYFMGLKQAKEHSRNSWRVFSEYVGHKFKLANFNDPFSKSIGESIRHFYETDDPRLRAPFATQVIEACTQMAATYPASKSQSQTQSVKSSPKGDVIVFGGSGFIGQALVRKLMEQGVQVKIFGRRDTPLPVDVIKGDIRDRNAVGQALAGATTVFHLARAQAKRWDQYVHNQIETTRLIAEEAQKAGIQRFIYTSTIDVYYAGEKGSVITEATPIDPDIACRNYYAQAKAAEEALLKQLELPLVITRPGIVIGRGSSPCHWGVGMWAHNRICRLWGKGENPLPFVWVDDVADGLILTMKTPNIDGQSFNFIDQPLLSGLEYIDALSKASKMEIAAYPTPIWRFFADECFKWGAKTVLRFPDRKVPSYHDWQSRTQLATYNCTATRRILGWTPLSNQEKLIHEGITLPAEEWFA